MGANPFKKPPPQSPAAGEEEPDEDYRELISHVKDAHERERLSLPTALPDDRVEFPLDIRSLSDERIQHLHWSANVYAARCAYVLSLEQRLGDACKAIADDLEEKALAQAEDKGTLTIIKAQIAQDEEVRTWRRRQRKHIAIADDFRKQREIYTNHVEALSRQHTMRTDEKTGSGR
jgi:hypothetical protein